ncbi:MAG: hypothetical protein GX749_01405 [Ruminococcaceae bacterium]|nr:hypothetical protein [Oscillospiraceae bacterium]
MNDYFAATKPTAHIKQPCEALGPRYSIQMVDMEQVICRDFGNGFSVEVSGTNTASIKKLATIYLWAGTQRIAKTLYDVPQCEIGDRVDELNKLTQEAGGKLL